MIVDSFVVVAERVHRAASAFRESALRLRTDQQQECAPLPQRVQKAAVLLSSGNERLRAFACTGRYAAEEVHRFSETEKTVARDINEA